MTNDKDGAALLREVLGRLSKFCDEWANMRHTDDDIHGLHFGEDRQSVLCASDIRTVVAALQSHGQAFDAAGVREACANVAESWVKCDYSEECNILADSIADEIRALPIPEPDAIGSHFGNGGGLDPVRACGCPECEASPGFGGGDLREALDQCEQCNRIVCVPVDLYRKVIAALSHDQRGGPGE